VRRGRVRYRGTAGDEYRLLHGSSVGPRRHNSPGRRWNSGTTKGETCVRRPPAVALLLVAGVRVVRLAVGVRVVCFVLVAREQVAVGEDRLDLVGWSLLVLLVVDRDRGDANALGRQLAVVGLREGVERERDRLVGREALLVLLLQIVAEVAPVGADRERLPLVGRAGRVGLEQARLAVLDPADDQRDAEGRAPPICVYCWMWSVMFLVSVSIPIASP